jgi:large subunit ribosomal protein L25
MTLELKVEKRDTNKESNDSLRKEGFIPAVFYGRKEKSTSIKLKSGDFLKVYKEAGESTVINLKDGSEEYDALVHEVDIDPVKGNIRHVDFYIVEKGKKVTVNVPLEFIGESQGEKSGGVLVKVMHDVEIEAMPRNLPNKLEISIESLVEVGSQIHAKDIKLPEGVELKIDPEETIALIQQQKEETEEAGGALDLSSIEVEGEKKKESEESEGEKERE